MILAILLAAGVALAALVLTDWRVLKPYAESALGEALGRSVVIGSLDIALGTVSVIRLHGVRIANPDWAERENLAQVKELHVALRSWPLVLGSLELVEVRAVAPEVNLERNARGQATWEVGPLASTTGEIAAPETREEVPEIERLRIEDGVVRYSDAIRGITLDGKVATAKGEAEAHDQVELALQGRLEEKPLSLSFKGGSLSTLRDTEAAYPVDLEISFAETSLAVKGTMTQPLQMHGLDLEIELEGPTLAQLYQILGIPLQHTRPYTLSGAMKRKDDVWSITNLHGTVGDSDLSGEAMLDRSKEPPFLKADLVSNKLVLSDLAGLIGVKSGDGQQQGASTSDGEGSEGGDSFFPQTDVARDRLRAMNMDIRFEGQEVINEHLPIDQISARLQLTNGRVEVQPLELAVAGGTVAGEVALNARGEVPSADANLSFSELSLKPFFEGTDLAQEMAGRFSGELQVLGEGENLDQMMATVGGQGWIAMQGGSISGLVVEAIGLDVAEALALAVGEDARVAIRCGRADLDASAGTITTERAIIDTTDSVILVQGTVNMKSETMDLQVEARPKDFSLIDVAAPVSLSGSFKEPSVSIGGLDPLPFLEVGEATDLNCERLLSGKLSPLEVKED